MKKDTRRIEWGRKLVSMRETQRKYELRSGNLGRGTRTNNQTILEDGQRWIELKKDQIQTIRLLHFFQSSVRYDGIIPPSRFFLVVEVPRFEGRDVSFLE